MSLTYNFLLMLYLQQGNTQLLSLSCGVINHILHNTLTLNGRTSSVVLSDMNFLYMCKKSKGLPRQAKVAQGVPDRLRPWIILTFRHYKGGRSSAKCTGCLYPRRNPWYSLSEGESISGHMVL